MTIIPSAAIPSTWQRPKHWPDLSLHSKWRQPSCIAGLSSSKLECLNITQMPINLQLSQPTTMSVHPSEIIVVGSRTSSGSNNGELQFVSYSDEGFRAIRRFSIGNSCTSLSWMEDRLICGTGRGDAILYQLNPESIPKMLAISSTYSHEKIITSDTNKSNPSSYPVSMRLNSTRINPIDIDLLSVVENNRLHIWNFSRPDSSLFSGKIAASPLFVAEWSPHSVDQIAIGGFNQSVRLFDTRQLVKAADRAVTWKISDAHLGPIKSVSWSPLVPHWIATGSDDGSVKLWDIRLNKGPFRSLERHTNAVLSTSWSSSHAEILVTSSTDCSCRIWNLTLPPHYIMNTCRAFQSPPIITSFSTVAPNRFFALASDGDLQTVEMTPDFFREFIPQRFQDKGSAEYAVVEKLYCRDLESAISLITDKGGQLWKEQRYDKTSQIVSLYSHSEFETLLKDIPDSYENLVQKLSFCLSPLATTVSTISEATSLKLRILRTRLAIHNFIKRKQHEELLLLENDVIALISTSDDSFSASQLQSIIETILPKEYIRALKMTLRIGECLRDRARFSDFVSISTLVMSPTIYDPLAEVDDVIITPALSKKASVAIERDLRNPKVVIPQLELLIKVHAAITRPDGPSTIVQIMEDQQGSKLIPSNLHRIYFNALVQLKHYDKLFILATQLAQQLEGYPFSSVLLKLMEDVALPKISNFFSQDCIEGARNSGATNLLVAGTLSVVNMTQNCAILPGSLKDDLPRWILTFSSELEQHLKQLPADEAGSQVNLMADQMNQIRDSKRTSQTFCKDELGVLNAVLKKHGSRAQSSRLAT